MSVSGKPLIKVTESRTAAPKCQCVLDTLATWHLPQVMAAAGKCCFCSEVLSARCRWSLPWALLLYLAKFWGFSLPTAAPSWPPTRLPLPWICWRLWGTQTTQWHMEKLGELTALFAGYTIKGISKLQCLTEVLMKSLALLISCIITRPFLFFPLTTTLHGATPGPDA